MQRPKMEPKIAPKGMKDTIDPIARPIGGLN